MGRFFRRAIIFAEIIGFFLWLGEELDPRNFFFRGGLLGGNFFG